VGDRGLTKQEFEVLLQTTKDQLGLQLQATAMMAKITRAKYLALRLEGFAEAQALELCK
jgi:hypothetical protein